EVEVPAGTNLIEAARAAGAEVPHYCYHPSLSIAGQCRLCMVDIDKVPRPQIACNTVVAEGMVVETETARVKDTRRSMMEFHLVNHPLDCPVCDQAGECLLQIYYMKHGLYDPRMTDEKVHKPKAVPLGPHVMLDAERCILCSRCVRFCDEITGTGELGIFNRGDHSERVLLPRPLPPPLALRALLRRDPRHRRARHLQPRRSLGDRALPRARPHQQLLDQRGGHLPGGRAHRPGLPLPGPRLVPGRCQERL